MKHSPLFLTIIYAVCILISSQTLAGKLEDQKHLSQLIAVDGTLNTVDIQESYKFFGLAAYYNNVDYYIVESDQIQRVKQNVTIELGKTEWLVVVGRYNALVIRKAGLVFRDEEKRFLIQNHEVLRDSDAIVDIVKKTSLKNIALELDQIRFAHLWSAFAWLAKLCELLLVAIYVYIIESWFWAIVILSVLIKVAMLPLSIFTARSQRRVSLVQAQLLPRLEEIKANYDGEEAHNRIMSAHKNLAVTPFFTIKPMLITLIQVPILIAVFNALGEMPQLDGQEFLWIQNLAYPDAALSLYANIPMFGNTINALPVLMTVITLVSARTFQNQYAPKGEVERQKRNLYLMAVGFLVLFYPFPAAMVIYWTLVNALQIIQQRVVKI